jgi:hypothetical protein
MEQCEKSEEANDLIQRERWYLSEQLGYDCTTTAYGICALNNRVLLTVTSNSDYLLNSINNESC